MARGAVVARVVLTAADGRATVASGVSWWAGAGVAGRSLLAGAAILARVRRALVPGAVAVHAGETVWALTQVGVDEIDATSTCG